MSDRKDRPQGSQAARWLAALVLGTASFQCATAQAPPANGALMPALAAADTGGEFASLPAAAPPATAQPAPQVAAEQPSRSRRIGESGGGPRPAPAANQPTRASVPLMIEEYGREFYPGFFPELPAAAELQEGHLDVPEQADLEEQLLGPPEPGFLEGRVTLSRRQQRRLEPGRTRPIGGTGVSQPTRQPPSMYHLGLFWWRDDTLEIEGRGPYRPDMPPKEHEICPGVTFGGPETGLTWKSEDDYFRLTFHDLTQLDLRESVQQGDPLHGGFIIPRQRWYFEGRVGDYANFVTSINRGYGSLDVLDSYVDYNVNPEWLQFRVGRMKTPAGYEYLLLDEANLIGPERSLWMQNFSPTRQLGAMAHGYLNDRMFNYYLGVFNGPRRSFEDFNSGRDYFFMLDYRPFRKCDICWLEGVHLTGAYNFGEERNPLLPVALHTMNQAANSTAISIVSPTILEFNNNVFENGPREFYDFELVYYFRSVGFLTGYQGGYQDYSVAKSLNPYGTTRQNAAGEFLGVQSPYRTHVPETGWSWQGWWFITGEEITRRVFLVEPRRPFGYYNGTLNPGAWELFTKVSELQLGNQVFTGGIADPKLWANQATAVEVGFNWYLNHFVKFDFDYQHTFLNNPVILDPNTNAFTKHYDFFLFRTQLFF